VCVCLFVIGCFYTLWGTNALSAIQLEAPEHLRGRAASLYFFAFLGGAPLGGLFAGWLSSVGGTKLAFYVAGSIAVLTAAVGIARLAATTSSSLISR
jgi:MFS family permease